MFLGFQGFRHSWSWREGVDVRNPARQRANVSRVMKSDEYCAAISRKSVPKSGRKSRYRSTQDEDVACF